MKRRSAVIAFLVSLGCSRARTPPEASGSATRVSEANGGAVAAGGGAGAEVGTGAERLPAERRAEADGGADAGTGTGTSTGTEAAGGDMIFVPAGAFTMGSDRGGQGDEHPAHQVTLEAFWLDKTEVMNEAYERCVVSKVCRAHDPKSALLNRFGGDVAFRGPKQPISSISWDDARTFCAWLGKRLPTEAEWEKAARGTDARKFPWGDDAPDPSRGVYATTRTSDVGTHPDGKGPYGHLDMAGNVWEWLEDIYDPYAYQRPQADRGIPGTCEEVMAAQDELRRKGLHGYTGTNPIPTECERNLRGGAFNYDGPGLRSSNRVHHPSSFRLVMSGVRCAKSP
jgi:formylglycine-generating enzyme required for sulfatase activity